jgi:hypothetical protein
MFFFLQLTPCGHSPYVTSSLTRWVCLLWIGLVFFFKRTYRTNRMLLKIIPFALYIVLCQFRLWKADHAYLTYLVLQRQLSHLNGSKLDRRQFRSLIVSMSRFALSYAANMYIFIILYDFCLLPAQFYYTNINIYIRKVESRVRIADRCASWKISNGSCLQQIPRCDKHKSLLI